MKLKHILVATAAPFMMNAQQVMTPEIMWTLNRLGVQSVSPDNSALIYKISKTDLKTEKSNSETFWLNASGQSTKIDLGKKSLIQWDNNGIYALENNKIFLSKDSGKTWSEFYNIGEVDNIVISPDGKKVAFSKAVHVENLLGKDKYKDLPKTTAQIYTDLNHRHWDAWNEGSYNHVFVVNVSESADKAKDLLEGKAFDSPQKPFGGAEDFVWSPDSSELLYVTKAKSGAEYAQSTNTDIFAYNLASGKTTNLTEGMMGYDVNPKFSNDGKFLLWNSMERDGYEADKNDIMVMDWKSREKTNLTKAWDESVTGDVKWASDSKLVYFTSAFRGTKQLFSVDVKNKIVKQLTKGDFDINDVVLENKGKLWVTKTDINHSADLFEVDSKGSLKQITNINKDNYSKLVQGKSELKMVKTTDAKEMGVWFHYPPNFDPNKKYPTLVYCQGGPQSGLTQFFSTRWNFALMAANGYIVVAPNRRGMPGWGVKWNEEISGDWGGQPIKDYLSATDFAKTLSYVDGNRVAAVGASYGGYSVFMLAGVHENRFKTFIAHDGLFDMKSWYGTTEELWFANWDLGGNYWQKPTPKAYSDFNPSNFVDKWNKPIMVIQGGIDFRVPYEQGQEAFQAAKLKGLKTKFLYFPNENHWVLHPQNGLVWQREFFDWLKETL
ncbi:S9 family peptidase [Epilithonimonas arachidiradicis]|uniref:Dipeptidyl aminopeptidase/acylaminoacyl peptidase n=1 Tax=Epilithonimonas arachidiradicis TaxID=1617282 RepID=A0A420CPR9_9FLAO|nr:S9 family peptidase [Epilithonimonas arachidiradicis]RKE80413.1 dipeptidyl aminopeptidase/acylaminoacyl peptidase [Epilithonimonas arachidiradicis]GGG63899.1 peptidase S9 [Epilithonimonas arachidiradicis]